MRKRMRGGRMDSRMQVTMLEKMPFLKLKRTSSTDTHAWLIC